MPRTRGYATRYFTGLDPLSKTIPMSTTVTLRKRGHTYGRAIRGVADRLLGLACTLLQRHTLFDPDHGKTVEP